MSGDPPLLATLEDFLVAVLSSVRHDAADRLPELGLSFSQAKVLLAVGTATQPLPINVVAERVGVTIATAGRHTDRLVKLGLLTRDECTTDRRVKLVWPSERGRDVIAAHLEVRKDALRTFVRRLPDHVREPLHSALRAALDCGAVPTAVAAS